MSTPLGIEDVNGGNTGQLVRRDRTGKLVLGTGSELQMQRPASVLSIGTDPMMGATNDARFVTQVTDTAVEGTAQILQMQQQIEMLKQVIVEKEASVNSLEERLRELDSKLASGKRNLEEFDQESKSTVAGVMSMLAGFIQRYMASLVWINAYSAQAMTVMIQFDTDWTKVKRFDTKAIKSNNSAIAETLKVAANERGTIQRIYDVAKKVLMNRPVYTNTGVMQQFEMYLAKLSDIEPTFERAISGFCTKMIRAEVKLPTVSPELQATYDKMEQPFKDNWYSVNLYKPLLQFGLQGREVAIAIQVYANNHSGNEDLQKVVKKIQSVYNLKGEQGVIEDARKALDNGTPQALLQSSVALTRVMQAKGGAGTGGGGPSGSRDMDMDVDVGMGMGMNTRTPTPRPGTGSGLALQDQSPGSGTLTMSGSGAAAGVV
jgi:hypothetical protein